MDQPFPIADLASLPEPVFSVYLNTNPLRHLNRNADHGGLNWFHRQAKRLLASMDSTGTCSLTTEISRVAQFLERNPPDDRGVALFSGPGIWHVIRMPMEPENELHWGKPMLWQLTAIAQRHRPSCVAVIERSGVRLFSSRGEVLTPMDTLEFHIEADQWKRMQAFHTAERKAGMPHGPQRDLFERRCDTQYLRFLAEAAQRLTHACEVHDLHQVLLLGPRRSTEILERGLPLVLRKQTAQVPHLWREWDSVASLTHVEEALLRFEAARRQQRVSELLNRGPSVVTGADETLAILQRGRLGRLMADESFDPVLRYCTRCDHASASSTQQCPRCSGDMVNLSLHAILPQLLIRCHCRSEFLSGEPAERLRRVGGIGGWLRQRMPVSGSEPRATAA
ncbi:MAG: VLRF1 family aeRF1-type release factor [Acidobacteriota bacterium]